MKRREFLLGSGCAGLALSPLALALAACGRESALPDGMVEIKWDRDTCTRCTMVISDRRFAAEIRGGPKGELFKFDDIGCALCWLKAQKWGGEAAARIWVADSTAGGTRWLDARQAQFVDGHASPMGYGFAALAQSQSGSVGFDEMHGKVMAKEFCS